MPPAGSRSISKSRGIMTVRLLLVFMCVMLSARAGICSVLSVHAIPDTITGNPPDKAMNNRDSLMAATDTLPELTVRLRTVTHRGSTDMYLVTKEMRDGAHVAGDLLGKIPGIFYNPLDQSMSYLGSPNIKVLVDSLERDEQYIKRLNPDRFVRISVTNYPAGKYAGYDAVVNLTTKKAYVGYDGTVLAEMNLSPGNNNGRGNHLSIMRDILEVTYTRDKWNFAFSGTFNYQRVATGSASEITYPLNDYSQVTEMPPLKEPNKFTRRNETPLNIWADYRINNRHTLSLGVSLVTSSSSNTDNSTVLTGPIGQTLTPRKQLSKDSYRGAISPSVNLQYLGTVGKWKLNASAQFTDSRYNRFYSKMRGDFSIEDNRRVSSNFLWTGANASRYISGFKMMMSFSDYLTVLDYKEKGHEGGMTLSSSRDIRNTLMAGLQYFPSNSFVIGLNAGMNLSSGTWSGKKQTNISPHLMFNLMWAIRKLTFRLNYWNTTSYPTIAQQQGYGAFSDSLIYMTGNPGLAPMRTNSIALTVNAFRFLTFSTDFTHIGKSVFNIAETGYGPRPDGTTGDYVSYQYQNGSYKSWRGNVTFTKTFRKKWTVSATVSVDHREAWFGKFRSARTPPTYNWYVMYDNPKGALQMYLSSSLKSGLSVTPQQIGWSCYESYGLSAVKFLFSHRLQIVAMVPVPIHFFNKPYRSELHSPGYVYHMWNDSNSRRENDFTVTLVWRFRGGEQTRKTNHRTETINLY